MEKETVLVGMSGGVDSTVAALLLKEQGYNVIGAIMSIWSEEKQRELAPLNEADSCKESCYKPNKKEDIKAAKQIAQSLNIPFFEVDCTDAFDEIVLNNFKQEYLQGRTPNPCVICNNDIKFDIFPKRARLQGINFNKFATGHYVQVEFDKTTKRYIIKKGKNLKKDQSYFLYKLSQKQLSNILTPLGGYEKEEIRELAKKAGLNVADKKDSQDFFNGDYNKLLEVTSNKGNIVNSKGEILGQHEGIWNFTIGQRKGIGIAHTAPLYVIELKEKTNEVIVGEVDETFQKRLKAVDLNWVSVEGISKETKVEAKFRSSQSPKEVIIKPEAGEIWVDFIEPQKALTKGQSIVFYDGDILLGGGIIDEVK